MKTMPGLSVKSFSFYNAPSDCLCVSRADVSPIFLFLSFFFLLFSFGFLPLFLSFSLTFSQPCLFFSFFGCPFLFFCDFFLFSLFLKLSLAFFLCAGDVLWRILICSSHNIIPQRCRYENRRTCTCNDSDENRNNKAPDRRSAYDDQRNHYTYRCKRCHYRTANSLSDTLIDSSIEPCDTLIYRSAACIFSDTVEYYDRIVNSVTEYSEYSSDKRAVYSNVERSIETDHEQYRVSERKYGSSNGKYQEKEGPDEARLLLKRVGGYTSEEIDRICYLVGHHHTYSHIDGLDYQILVEADWLVNIYEDGLSQEVVNRVRANLFKTPTALHLLDALYGGTPWQAAQLPMEGC